MEVEWGTTVMVIMIMMYHHLDILLLEENKSPKCLQGTVPGNAEKLHYLLRLLRAHSRAEAP